MRNGVIEAGPRGALSRGEDGVVWRVWAPRAPGVDLVLVGGGDQSSVRMESEGDGTFAYHSSAVPEGQRYCYRLGDGHARPDPASRWQPEGVAGPSAVLRPERFRWFSEGWDGVWREDLVFYEIHVGTFTPEGTFDGVVRRLHRLRTLGVTAVELMPVAQFPGGRNWGYDGVFPYAPQDSYGGPYALQRLVDACHAEGLAVFLDVVYNHLGPEGNYLREFGPYFTDRYATPWGEAVNYDGAGSGAVRSFVLENVRMWLEDYRLDGLRLDAVHAIYDSGPVHILTEIQRTADDVARRRGWPAHVIAESDLNDVKLLRAPEEGGWGVEGQWSDDFHHAVHAFLTGEHHGYYVDYGRPQDLSRVLEEPFLLNGVWSRHRGRHHGTAAAGFPGDRFVICLQNHDQVGNRATGDRLSTLLDPPRRRLAASLLLLSPHLPLLFMGEEYGEDRPFPFFCSFGDPQLAEAVRAGRRREFAALARQDEVPDPQDEATFASAKLSWSWPEGSPRKLLRRLYRHLLAARQVWPALTEFGPRSARLLPVEGGPGVIELVRGALEPTPGKTLRAFFNLGGRTVPLPTLTNWERVLFRSESERYGGPGDVVGHELRPYECVAAGPTMWPHVG